MRPEAVAIEITRVCSSGASIVMRTRCFHCDRVVSIEHIPDPVMNKTAWTCPARDCERPNVSPRLREIRATWIGQGPKPLIRRIPNEHP